MKLSLEEVHSKSSTQLTSTTLKFKLQLKLKAWKKRTIIKTLLRCCEPVSQQMWLSFKMVLLQEPNLIWFPFLIVVASLRRSKEIIMAELFLPLMIRLAHHFCKTKTLRTHSMKMQSKFKLTMMLTQSKRSLRTGLWRWVRLDAQPMSANLYKKTSRANCASLPEIITMSSVT